MRIILQENHDSPVVSMQLFVKSGSIYEGKYLKTGISHFVEHVIDDGTTKRSRGEIDELVEYMGNISNACIWRDHTKYYITTASGDFDMALDLLSDYIQNATFPEEEVEIQRQVILSEFDADGDEPHKRLIEELHDIGFYDIYGHIFVAGETEDVIRSILTCDMEWKKRDYQLTGEVVESIVNAVKELIAYHELSEIEMRKQMEEYPHLRSVERELEKAHEIGEKILGTSSGEILIELIARFREHIIFIFKKRENIKRYIALADCPNLEEEI